MQNALDELTEEFNEMLQEYGSQIFRCFHGHAEGPEDFKVAAERVELEYQRYHKELAEFNRKLAAANLPGNSL